MRSFYALTIAFLYLQFDETATRATTEFSGDLSQRTNAEDGIRESDITNSKNTTFIVSIRYNKFIYFSKTLCSGILINSNSVLTLASCVDSFDKNELEVRLNTSNEEGVIIRNIIDILILERQIYTYLHTINNDFNFKMALIKLDMPIEESIDVSFAHLGRLKELIGQNIGDKISDQTMCTISGYGKDWSNYRNENPMLKYFNITIVGRERCQNQYYPFEYSDDATLLCGVVKEPENACIYETGVSLICEGKVIGLSRRRYDMCECTSDLTDLSMNPCKSMTFIFIPIFSQDVMKIVVEPLEEIVLQSIEDKMSRRKRFDDESKSNDTVGISAIYNLMDKYFLTTDIPTFTTTEYSLDVNKTQSRNTLSEPQSTHSVSTTEEPLEVTNKQRLENNVNNEQQNRSIEERNANVSVITDKPTNISDTLKIALAGIEQNASMPQPIKDYQRIANNSLTAALPVDLKNTTEVRTMAGKNIKKETPKVYAGSVKDERGCAKAGTNSNLLSTFYPFGLSVVSVHFFLSTGLIHFLF